jgi:hypothetical protein
MRNLLQDADRDRLVAPLATTLAGEVAIGGTVHRALAQAAGSSFFAAEANARAAELLLLPGLRERHLDLSDALLDFLVAMADAPVPCRRAAAGRVALTRADPRDFEAVTPFFRLSGDLGRGVLRQSPRGAARPDVLHTGNLVEFGIAGRQACVDVEDAITEQDATWEGDRLVLRHLSTIRGRGGLLARREMEAGRLECRYEIAPDSPLLHLVVTFTATHRLGRVRVTTALDALDESGLGATAARLREGIGWRGAAPPAEPGAADWGGDVPVSHLALGPEGWPQGAWTLHLRPADPARIMRVTAQAARGGALRWLLLRHGPMALKPGESVTVRETRLLARIADPRRAAAAMEAGLWPEMAGLDLDPAPPSGAALHAAAVALLFDAAGAWATPLPEERRGALLAFVLRQAERIEAAETGTEDLAYAVLATDALRRAGHRIVTPFQGRLLGRLVALARDPQGLLRDPAGAPSLAAQALGILAMARGATWPEGGGAAAALPPLIEAVGQVRAGIAPGLGFAGEVVDAEDAAEAVALLGRAAGAVVLAGGAGAPLAEATLARARELHRVSVNLLRAMVHPRDQALEVLPRGGLDPATQALTTLAFMAPDRLLLGGA